MEKYTDIFSFLEAEEKLPRYSIAIHKFLKDNLGKFEKHFLVSSDYLETSYLRDIKKFEKEMLSLISFNSEEEVEEFYKRLDIYVNACIGNNFIKELKKKYYDIGEDT